MTDFDYEVYQKKRIASGARHRICGSKSKKCSLPSDNLSKRQWKERCGEVVSYNMSKPMTWDVFCKLPSETQKEYLLYLINRYSVSAREISGMLGISPSYFSRYCTANKVGVKFQSKKVPESAKQIFEEFCMGKTEELEHETQVQLVSNTEKRPAEPKERSIVVDCTEEKKPEHALPSMAMTDFTINFDGPFDADALRNSLGFIIRKGDCVKLEIKCTIQR